MGYLPEDKIYIYVTKEDQPPVFPVGLNSLDVSTTPIGEGLVQVIGVPKIMKTASYSARVKSLEIARRLKDKDFVLVQTKYENENLLILIKNSAVWLTKVVSDRGKKEALEEIKNYVSLNFNQEITKNLSEVEVSSPSRNRLLNAVNFSPKTELPSRPTLLVVVILATLIFLFISLLYLI